ncbi:hypothetical protein [Candidatus Pelagibacter communis]|uniref:hypothetical protein n=1 Tax=Pelagibacter ubique TaxID=198252 RepID=UPI00094D9A65|nr:hypothetical protein [Candidatus Pelagibacter ubique]|tara:strand:- start:627 stop:1682 length:1056 start_codon:yes stop_codon:yes gene_type:complete
MKYLINFKKTLLYKKLLSIFVCPVYEIFWQYFINFDRKIIFIMWKLKHLRNSNEHNEELKKNFCKLVNKDNDLDVLTQSINNELNENDLKLSKIIDDEFSKLKNETRYNVTNSGNQTYKIEIFDFLSSKLKQDILKFAISDKMISISTDYLKVFPILNQVKIYKNYPTKFPKRGAMLWHKDDFGYKSLDLFINVSDVDHENGPLHVIKKNNPLGVFSKSAHEISNPVIGERGKIDDKYIDEKNNSENISIVKGQGNGVLIDSFRVYHRGGHCKKKNRIMMRLSYQTKDSLTFKTKENKINLIENLNDIDLKKFFIKELVNYKPGVIVNNLKFILMKFYRILHYKNQNIFKV